MSYSLTRRDFLGSAASAAATAQNTSRPNYIFFMPDTLRAESIACYGHPVVKTPNIDRVASQGVRFAQCHAQNPVCGPSRCSLMTGWPVHVRGHRSLYYGLHPDEPNLLRYLKDSGYDVFWYGKNDLLSPDSFPLSATEWGSKAAGLSGYRNPWKPEDPHFYSFLWSKLPDRRKTSDYANVQAAIEVLGRKPDRPFCLYLPLICPHPPFAAPEDFHDMYKPGDVPRLRPSGLERKPNFYEAIRRTRNLGALSEQDFRKIQAVYLGMISYSDWLLGELLESLAKTGLDRNTAVFVFSDHGEWGGDYGLVEKWPSAMEDTLTRVPMIAQVPGFRQGHVSADIIELYDLMATCLELSGIEAKHTHFARSFVPQLRGGAGDPNRAAFCEGGYNVYEPQDFEPLKDFSNPSNIYYPKVRLQNEHPETITRTTMIRTADMKLIARPDGQSELYDVVKDPRELHNVHGDSSYAKRQAELEARMMAWYIRTPAALMPPRGDDAC